MAYHGQIGDEEVILPQALDLQHAAEGKRKPKFVQARFQFEQDDHDVEPHWVEIDVKNVKLENEKKRQILCYTLNFSHKTTSIVGHACPSYGGTIRRPIFQAIWEAESALRPKRVRHQNQPA